MSPSNDARPAAESRAAQFRPDSGILKVRALRSDERPFAALDTDLPLVFDAVPRASLDALREYLARSSEDVMRQLHAHGALLLRGFPIASTRDFEETLFSIRALRPMRGYFMPETGRVRVEGSERIFHTNAFMKTGGTLHLGGFHNENYYSSDVPGCIAFCCLDEPSMGGETGIVHMTRAYRELGDALKAKLESEPSCAMSWPLSAIASTYGLGDTDAAELCREIGFDVAPSNGVPHVFLYKPNVFIHPVTGLPSLHLNVSAEVRGLNEHIRELLSSVYGGPQWALHRLAWRYPAIGSGINDFYRVSGVLHNPAILSKLVSEFIITPLRERQRASGKPSDLRRSSTGTKFDDNDARALAAAMMRHINVVTWRRGDILLVDNLQMLHTGMPGFGERRIEVALCNPVALRWPMTKGAVRADLDDRHETVFERFVARAEKGRHAASPNTP